MTWQDAQQQFATSLPGYADRPQQTRLAETIEKAFANDAVLLGQAGTGTGKSLAGLVPAIDHAVASGTPVVVATATKSLQTQYSANDLPFLSEHLGIDFTWAMLKGRGNYACAAKIADLGAHSFANQEAVLTELAEPGHSGDLDELEAQIDPADRVKITSTSEECPGKANCPFAGSCFAEKAKTAAQTANVILVNHALLATDLVIKLPQYEMPGEPTGILPRFGHVLVDEAHEFSDYVTGALGKEVSERTFSFFATEALNLIGQEHVSVTASLTKAATILFRKLDRELGKISTRRLDTRFFYDLVGEFEAVTSALRAIGARIEQVETGSDDKRKMRRIRLLKKTSSLLERVESVVLAESTDIVRWIERDAKRADVRLKYAPITVAPFLRDALWSRHAGVLLSATLAVGSDFSYVASQLGLDDYLIFDAGSAFDYPRQAAIFIPTGFDPSPNNTLRWRSQVWETQKRLIAAAGGRTLALFTSTSAMNQAHDAIAPYLRSLGLLVLKQGEESNKKLAEQFRENETSVLFGLKSFATGFDVPGDSLRLVIIDKMPFVHPDDVIFKARCDARDAQARNKWVDGSFPTLAVPAMALTLLQSVGRLIRSVTDEGLIAILDSRLLPKTVDPKNGKPYSAKIRQALPPARMVSTLDEAVDFLTELGVRRG